MPRYLLAVTFADGDGVPPLTEWKPEEVQAHLDYYGVLNDQLAASGELVGHTILTGPDLAIIVTGDGQTAPVRTDGPFAEVKEMIGGFFLVDCATRDEALAIARRCPAAQWASVEVRETGPCFR